MKKIFIGFFAFVVIVCTVVGISYMTSNTSAQSKLETSTRLAAYQSLEECCKTISGTGWTSDDLKEDFENKLYIQLNQEGLISEAKADDSIEVKIYEADPDLGLLSVCVSKSENTLAGKDKVLESRETVIYDQDDAIQNQNLTTFKDNTDVMSFFCDGVKFYAQRGSDFSTFVLSDEYNTVFQDGEKWFKKTDTNIIFGLAEEINDGYSNTKKVYLVVDPDGNEVDGNDTIIDGGRYTLKALTTGTYNITYNLMGGTGSFPVSKKTHDVDYTIVTKEPTKTYHTFLGWSVNTAAVTVDYNPGDVYNKNEALNLYAVWESNSYTITYDANGGTGAPPAATKIAGMAAEISDVEPTREGYDFIGWATYPTAVKASYVAGNKYTKDEDLSLYAVWKIHTYTVSYDTSDASGTMLSDGSYTLSGNGVNQGIDSGETVNGLTVGSYTVTENSAPSGYVNESKSTSATVSGNSTVTATISDKEQKCKITITQEAKSSGTKLSGAKFEVHQDDPTGAVVATVTTGSNGTCTTGELYLGTYYVVQIEAPSGYEINQVVQKVVFAWTSQNQTTAVLTDNLTFINDIEATTSAVETNILQTLAIKVKSFFGF